MRLFESAVLVAAIAAMAPAAAQAQTPQSAIAAGLEAQYRAAIIRERRMAGDRELRLIADSEGRMRQARQALERAGADRQAAQTALEAARADFRAAVLRVPFQDAFARIEVEAFAAEMEGRVAAATPDLIAAYEAFADGDRAAAWSRLEPLLQAQARARVAAARGVSAAEIRQLAQLRGVMRANGEAATADVLALWTQSIELDPDNFWAHVEVARLERDAGNMPRAAAEAERAIGLAQRPMETGAAYALRGDLAMDQRDYQRAYYDYLSMQRAIEEYLVEDQTDWTRHHNYAIGRQLVGSALAALGDGDAALRAYIDSAQIMREIARNRPDDLNARREVSVTLTRIGDIQLQMNQAAAARASFMEALQMRRELLAADPTNVQFMRDVSQAQLRVGDAMLAQREVPAAYSVYQDALPLGRDIVRADPSSASARLDLALILNRIGDLERAQGVAPRARMRLEEAVSLAEPVVTADPGNVRAQRTLWSSLWKLAELPEGGVTWAQVLSALEAADRAGALVGADRARLDQARQNRDAANRR